LFFQNTDTAFHFNLRLHPAPTGSPARPASLANSK
jgi:hypothetical protein